MVKQRQIKLMYIKHKNMKLPIQTPGKLKQLIPYVIHPLTSASFLVLCQNGYGL